MGSNACDTLMSLFAGFLELGLSFGRQSTRVAPFGFPARLPKTSYKSTSATTKLSITTHYTRSMPRKFKEDIDLEDMVDDERPPAIEPYTVLGLEKTATPDDIKKAYRKAALKHHPGMSTPSLRYAATHLNPNSFHIEFQPAASASGRQPSLTISLHLLTPISRQGIR